MIVTKVVDFTKEVDVSVSLEEIVEAIGEANREQGDRSLMRGVNSCAQFLKAIPDDIIRGWSKDKKKVVEDFLREQANRFSDYPKDEAGFYKQP